ncbi:MAG TPA: response regulator transcription factor [Vicinamibacterales bacterium]|nr:response regulator transcription factor [Vicinamibacterales bacterium]
MTVRVLVIEDEVKVAQALREGLEDEHYDVTIAETGEDGFNRASSQLYDLVLLDAMLPGRDGLDVLRALRTQGMRSPVLMLTARDGVDDRVRGLDSGADDYLVKPFAFPELLARMRVLLRRGRDVQPTRFSAADLELDLVARRATRGGRQLDLTAREFDVLAFLLRHAGQLVSRDMLAQDVWKGFSRATSLDNVIDVHMARIRKKVDSDFSVKLIHTVRGVGFTLRDGRA